MKRCLFCAIGIALMMSKPAFAIPPGNFVSLEKDEFPCQLEEYFDYDRDAYVQMGKIGERSIEIKQRHFSFHEREMVCDTFVYGGMLYVPVRQTAEFLNKTVIFSSEDQIVSIIDGNGELQQTDRQTGELNNVSQTKKISVSRYPIHYGNMVLEGAANPLCIVGIFSCEGKLYMPLKTLTEYENIVRIYDGDNVLLLDDFPDGEIIETSFIIGVSDQDTPEVDDETLKKALIKVAAYCTEPGGVKKIEGEKALYYGKPAVVIRVLKELFYESGMEYSSEILDGYIYVLEE